jgi:hypothetical protein
MKTMPALREITSYDRVELIEPVESVPAGAQGGVLELRDGDRAMVEITSPQFDAADRIVFVPLDKLRLIR